MGVIVDSRLKNKISKLLPEPIDLETEQPTRRLPTPACHLLRVRLLQKAKEMGMEKSFLQLRVDEVDYSDVLPSPLQSEE